MLQGWNNGRESSASRYRSRYFWPRLFVPTKSIDSAHGDAVLPWFIVAGIVSSVNDIRLRFGRTTLMQMQKRRVKSFVALFLRQAAPGTIINVFGLARVATSALSPRQNTVQVIFI